jgi:1-acyl-sn-glycerol-3-phosphate acyltransferase
MSLFIYGYYIGACLGFHDNEVLFIRYKHRINMITANKKKIITKFGRIIAHWILAIRFAGVYLHLPREVNDFNGPLILCGNHSYEWDAMLVAYIAEILLKRDCFAMVKSTSMQRYKFLRTVGCFEMDASDPYKANASISYAANLIRDQEKRSLIIFPQGDIQPWGKRPLGFQPGFSYVARKIKNGAVLPIGIKFERVVSNHPNVFISVGCPQLIPEPFPATQQFVYEIEELVIGELSRIDRERYGFKTVL